MFNPSIVIVRIPIKLLGLVMLSTGLLVAIHFQGLGHIFHSKNAKFIAVVGP